MTGMPPFDGRRDVDGVWQDYTPTLTNVTLGSGGTVKGRYTRIGTTILFSVIVTLGTGGTITGTPLATFPTPSKALLTQQATGIVQFTDAGTNTYTGSFFHNSTTQMGAYGLSSTGAFSGLSGASPFTWTVNDRIAWSGSYEAAT